MPVSSLTFEMDINSLHRETWPQCLIAVKQTDSLFGTNRVRKLLPFSVHTREHSLLGSFVFVRPRLVADFTRGVMMMMLAGLVLWIDMNHQR